MEALVAAAAAALAIYDMCKSIDPDMTVEQIRLEAKTGGVHGDYVRGEA
jgi:cyclic pyranopterin phosphate synthase